MINEFSSFKKRIAEIADWLSKELSGIRTGRATSAILDNISVEAYGSMMPINQVANLSVEDPKTIRITPWDMTLVKSIEKAISVSNLGLSTAIDEKGLRLFFPELTGDRRSALVKIVKEKLEEARVELRQERNKINALIDTKKKDSEISEDEAMRHKTEVDKLVTESNSTFDTHFDKKEKEIMN